MVLGVAERHRRADRSSITLVQLHVDEADPPPPLTHGGHHPHRAGVRRPQEIACHCDRLDCLFAMFLSAAFAHSASIAPPCTFGPMVQCSFSSPSYTPSL